MSPNLSIQDVGRVGGTSTSLHFRPQPDQLKPLAKTPQMKEVPQAAVQPGSGAFDGSPEGERLRRYAMAAIEHQIASSLQSLNSARKSEPTSSTRSSR
jgi:hypothetical protein